MRHMQRMNQVILIGSFIPVCWLAFMAIHELGHVVAGCMTGGTITKVVVHPLSISRTDVFPNPNPLLTAWAGPTIGALVPLALWVAFWALKIPGDYLARFFAGFCLIANGAYIGIGALGRIGDAGDLLNYGAPRWALGLFGIVAVPLGILLWNRLGPKFGLGSSNGKVDAWAAYLSLVLFAGVLLTTSIVSPRF